MKTLLLAALAVLAAFTHTAHAEDEVILFCKLDVPGDVLLILQNNPETDVWTVQEISDTYRKKESHPATSVGISASGAEPNATTIELNFPLSKGMLVVAASKKGWELSGHVKELDHGTETNYRECMPNGMRFYINNKALQSENLTHID
jgi:hypothetical protein